VVGVGGADCDWSYAIISRIIRNDGGSCVSMRASIPLSDTALTVPDPLPIIDISKMPAWHGVRPGLLRSEAVRALKAAGLEVDEADSEPEWLVATWEENGVENSLEMSFAGEGDPRLRQIILDNESSTWAGRGVIGKPLHEALAAIGDDAIGAGWRAECAYVEGFDDLNPPKPGTVSDESLIYEGTLWLPRRHLGLVMCEGVVNVVNWRRSEDFPRQFVGPVTEAQKAISARADCKDYVRERVFETKFAEESPAKSGNQGLLTLGFILVLAYLGWQAFLEQERWHTAPHIFGKVTEIVDTPNAIAKKAYRVSFADPRGGTHTANLEPGEFYVTPNAPGEEVEVAFVDGDPPRIMGLSRIRDAAFLRYVPWFIGATALYLLLSIVLRFLARQKRAQEGITASPVLPQPPGLQ